MRRPCTATPRGPVPLPVLRRLLEAVVPVEPGVRHARTTTATACCSPAACASRPRSTRRCRRPPRTRCIERAALPGRPGRGGDGGRPPHGVRPGDGRRQGRGLLGERRGAGRVNLATGAGGSGRQTGSAFKAFALVAALEQRLLPRHDVPAPASITLPLPGGGTWRSPTPTAQGYGTLSLRTATEDSVNTVYAQLIQQLGADTVVRTAEAMGMRCCTDVGEPTQPAARGRQRGARLQRGEHAGDGERLRHARDRRQARRSRARRIGGRPGRVDPVAGRPEASAGRRAPGGRGRQRHPAGRRPVRDRHRGEHRPAADRQDRHGRQPRQRVVRRRRPAALRRGVGRLPRGADPDGAAADEDHGVRRHVAGADLATVDAEGDRQRCRPSRSRLRR